VRNTNENRSKSKEYHEMTIHFPEDLESSIQAAVHSGRYVSVDDAITQAVRLLLHLPNALARKPLTEQELEQKLVEAGFLASVPPPRDPATPAWNVLTLPDCRY
jgi:Arc/MetJ-type ribon-helix-helix transcriptional regulator